MSAKITSVLSLPSGLYETGSRFILVRRLGRFGGQFDIPADCPSKEAAEAAWRLIMRGAPRWQPKPEFAS